MGVNILFNKPWSKSEAGISFPRKWYGDKHKSFVDKNQGALFPRLETKVEKPLFICRRAQYIRRYISS